MTPFGTLAYGDAGRASVSNRTAWPDGNRRVRASFAIARRFPPPRRRFDALPFPITKVNGWLHDGYPLCRPSLTRRRCAGE